MKLIRHSNDDFYYHTNIRRGSVLESFTDINKSEGFSKLKAIIPLNSIRPVRKKKV